MKPISKTAFYTCGIRMRDAESDNSVCGDVYAVNFMNEDGRRILEAFKEETGPNATIVARHRIIDDFLSEELSVSPDLFVILVGAGFDSRAFRLEGGAWLELDEPQLIEYKNERLPAAASENDLRRVSIDFSVDSLEEKLGVFSNHVSVAVVVEGVFMYLEETEIKKMLETLRRVFPRHRLICDLINRAFFEEYGKTLHEKLNGIGASFHFTADDPEKLFTENNYRRLKKISIVEKAVDFGSLNIPKIAFQTSLQTLAEGNAVYVFEAR